MAGKSFMVAEKDSISTSLELQALGVGHSSVDELSQAVTDLGLASTQSHPRPVPLSSSSTAEGSSNADSGYATQVPTPVKGISSENGFGILRKPLKLVVFDKIIPEAVYARYKEIKRCIDEPLSTHLIKKRAHYDSTAVRLKMLGSEGHGSSAKPFIIVLCDKRSVKRVKEFFNRSDIKQLYAPNMEDIGSISFGFQIIAKPPSQPAASTSCAIYAANQDNATLCGTLVQVENIADGRIATVGGVVKAFDGYGGHTLYAMTVSHVFTSPAPLHTVDESFDDASDEDPSTTCHVDEEEDFEIDLGLGDEPADSDTREDFEAGACDTFGPSDKTVLGWNPVPSQSLDWALFQLEDLTKYQPNKLMDPMLGTWFDLVEPSFKDSYEYASRSNVQRRAVWMLGGRSGTVRGVLAADSSSLLTRNGSKFVETYVLRLDSGEEVPSGDCGSWVVDTATREVLGHVVASDVFCDVYVVPLKNSLDDMKATLNARTVHVARQGDIVLYKHRSSALNQSVTEDVDLHLAPPNHVTDPTALPATIPVPLSGLTPKQKSSGGVDVHLPMRGILNVATQIIKWFRGKTIDAKAIRAGTHSNWTTKNAEPSPTRRPFDTPESPLEPPVWKAGNDSGYSSMQSSPHPSPARDFTL